MKRIYSLDNLTCCINTVPDHWVWEIWDLGGMWLAYAEAHPENPVEEFQGTGAVGELEPHPNGECANGEARHWVTGDSPIPRDKARELFKTMLRGYGDNET